MLYHDLEGGILLKREEMIEEMKDELLLAGKYMPCILNHATELVTAVLDEDMCAIWKIFEKCNVPCKYRWHAIDFIFRKVEEAKRQGVRCHFW
jgi:hypothetical protein